MRKTKKLLAVLLCLAMCFSLFPTWAFAEDADLQEQEEPAVAEAIAGEAEEQQEEDSSEADAQDIPTNQEEGISEPSEEREDEAEIEVAGDPDEGDIELQDDPDGIAINAENFPDDVFRALVSTFDTDPEDDPDGILSEDEIAAVTEIVYNGTEIVSMKGIEYFTELEVLIYGDDGFESRNPLSSLNLSNNTMLRTLSLQNTAITELDVTALTELEILHVGFTDIGELDLSQNPLLEDLICNNTGISGLDLSHNPELWKLDCCGNPELTVLNISACPILVDVYENDEWSEAEKDEHDGEYNYLEGIRVFGHYEETDEIHYNLAINDYTRIICEEPTGFEEFKAACENEEEGFDLSDLGEFTIEESLSIPENMFVNAEGTTVVIPAGVTLTVEGGMNAQTVEVQCSDEEGDGRLVIHGHVGIGSLETDGTVRIENWADNNIEDISGTGTIELKNDWLNIPAAIWTDDVKDMMSYLDNNCGVNIHLDAQDEEDIANAPEAAPFEEHVRPNIHVQFAWAPDDDFSVPEEVNFHIEADGSLTVPEGVSFEVNGYLGIHGADMTVEGNLINNGMVELMDADGSISHLTLEGGTYDGFGEIEIRTPCTLEGSFVGFNLADFVIVERDEHHIRGRFADMDQVYEAFREACENEEGYFELRNFGEFTISDNLTIPECMHVEAWGTTIIVPEDVTLTVEGQLNAESLIADGTVILDRWGNANLDDLGGSGSVVVRNAWLNLPLEVWNGARDLVEIDQNRDGGVNINLNAEDEEGIGNALDVAAEVTEERVHPNIHVSFGWMPEADFSTPDGVNFHIERDGSLTVPEEVRFTVNAYFGIHGTDVTVEGIFINNGDVELMEDDGVFSRLILDDGSYQGSGQIRVRKPAELEDSLIGFDLDEFSVWENDEENCARFVDADAIFETFRQACEDEEGYFDLRNLGEFTVQDNLTIPENMNVEAWGTTIVVPAGVKLTVNGNLESEGIEVQSEDEDVYGELLVLRRVHADCMIVDGKVILDNWADGDFNDLGGNGYVVVKNAWMNLPLEVWYDAGELVEIDKNCGGGVNINLDTENEEDIGDALAAVEGIAEERVHPNIHIHFEWMPDEDFSFPGGVNFQIERDGSLTIPEGISFEASGCLGIRGSDVTVGGTLINNGRIELTENDGEDPHLLLDGGIYRGMGEIWIEHPYTPETVLPGFELNMLNKVNEDENGTTWINGSVYDMLKAAIVNGPNESGDWHFQIPDDYELTISENMTIPAGMNIDGWNATIVIPQNVTLTVEGSEEHPGNINVGAMKIAGTVRVVGSGSLNVEGLWNENGLAEAVTTSGTGVLKLEGTQVQVMVPMETELSAANIQALYGAKLKLHAVAFDGGELTAALRAFVPKNNGSYRAFIEALGDCVLTGEVEIPENAEVLVINADVPWGSFAGGLTVSAGAVLTVNGFLGMQNAELIVEGTLVNNAQISLELAYGREEGDIGYLQVPDGGSYQGLGNIWVNGDDPDSHVNVPNPDIFIVDYEYDYQGGIRGANFRIGSYGITYDIAGASGTQPDARFGIPFGEEVLLATQGDLTREGYVFAGWYNVMTDTFYPADMLSTPIVDLNVRRDEEGNVEYCDFVVLGAVWNRDGYVVRFDGNGADSGSMDDQEPEQYDQYPDGYRVFLEPNKFLRDGWTFIGWNTEPDGSGRSYGDKGVVNLSPELLNSENGLVLYAQWKQEEPGTFKIFDIESGKKLDLVKASAISGASWSVTDGGQYATVTAKGVLTAKAVTECQTAYVEAVKGEDAWLIEVNIFPAATAMEIGHYSDAIGSEDGAEDAVFDDWENWVDATAQTVYVPYSGSNVRLAFQANPLPGDVNRELIVWSSSDKKSSVAELDTSRGNGQLIVTAKAAGTVTLTATCGKAKATVKLVIGSFIPDVSIKTTDTKDNPIFVTWTSSRTGAEYPAVRGGSTVTLQAVYDKSVKYTDSGLIWELVDWDGTDENGADIWVPAENPYAKLTPAGKLTTSVIGDAWTAAVRVSVKANPEICDVLEFVIAPAVQSVFISPPTVTGLAVGEMLPLEVEVVPSRAAGELTWKSSNTKIAVVTVDDDGEVSVEGKSAGAVTITATAADGSKKSASVKLTVANPTAVRINEPAKTELAGGEKLTLTVAGSPKVTWTSSNPSAAAVTAKGVVTAMKIARDAHTVITATAADGSADSVELTVKASAIAAPVNTISITGAGSVVGGNKLTLKAAVTDPKKPTNKTLVWSSSDPSVATVSTKGVVSTLPVDEPKSVVITVTAADGAGLRSESDSALVAQRSLYATRIPGLSPAVLYRHHAYGKEDTGRDCEPDVPQSARRTAVAASHAKPHHGYVRGYPACRLPADGIVRSSYLAAEPANRQWHESSRSRGNYSSDRRFVPGL